MMRVVYTPAHQRTHAHTGHTHTGTHANTHKHTHGHADKYTHNMAKERAEYHREIRVTSNGWHLFLDRFYDLLQTPSDLACSNRSQNVRIHRVHNIPPEVTPTPIYTHTHAHKWDQLQKIVVASVFHLLLTFLLTNK